MWPTLHKSMDFGCGKVLILLSLVVNLLPSPTEQRDLLFCPAKMPKKVCVSRRGDKLPLSSRCNSSFFRCRSFAALSCRSHFVAISATLISAACNISDGSTFSSTVATVRNTCFRFFLAKNFLYMTLFSSASDDGGLYSFLRPWHCLLVLPTARNIVRAFRLIRSRIQTKYSFFPFPSAIIHSFIDAYLPFFAVTDNRSWLFPENVRRFVRFIVFFLNDSSPLLRLRRWNSF